MGSKVYVGNLSYQATEEDLRQTFGQVGTVTDVKVIMDRESGRPRGFAFVQMSSDAEAQKALESLSGVMVQGRPINVSEAHEKERGGGGGYRGGGGGGGGGGGARGSGGERNDRSGGGGRGNGRRNDDNGGNYGW